MDKFRKVLLVLVCCVVAGCDSSGQHVKNVGKYAPILNAKPKCFMSVSGSVDSSFHKVAYLSFVTNYYTNNAACRYTVNAFEGVDSSRSKKFIYKIKSDKRGRYHRDIPLDAVVPGFCDWRIKNIGFSLHRKATFDNTTPIVFFDVKSGRKKFNEKNMQACDKGMRCIYISSLLGKGRLSPYPTHKYHYKLNIYRQDKVNG
ncbi:MAG: hypothetical protein KAS93_03515 [Gammaproteobacteria bacterium]|nr:hypothetical protein [Gammaproteobacteria bacterium]